MKTIIFLKDIQEEYFCKIFKQFIHQLINS